MYPQHLSMKIPKPRWSEMHPKQPSHRLGKLRGNNRVYNLISCSPLFKLPFLVTNCCTSPNTLWRMLSGLAKVGWFSYGIHDRYLNLFHTRLKIHTKSITYGGGGFIVEVAIILRASFTLHLNGLLVLEATILIWSGLMGMSEPIHGLERFLDIIGRDPSVPKSNRFFLVNLGYVL